MKRIVIVGASSGLGRDIAISFIRNGWKAGIAARREEPLKEIKDSYPDLVEYSVIDTTTTDAADRLADLIDRLGGMDIFLQAAGTGKQNLDLAPGVERTTVLTNALGFTTMVDTAFNYFANRPDRGLIAAITSVAGTKGLGAAPSYSATKRYQSTYLTALEQLAHIRRLPVDFCDIRPGFIATDLLDPSTRYPMLMTKAHAVPRIVRAIERRRRVAIIDRRWWWLVQGWKLIPRAIWVRIKATTNQQTS